MRVSVSPTHCQGHTMCNLAAPELFQLDDIDGHAYVENEQVPPELQAAARAGKAACPERAIEIEE